MKNFVSLLDYRVDRVSTLLALFNARVEITRPRNVAAFQRVIIFRIIKYSAGICIDNFIMRYMKM